MYKMGTFDKVQGKPFYYNPGQALSVPGG